MSERTVGVEEEFLLVSTDSTALAQRGDQVVDTATDRDTTAQFEHELKRAQAELASAPTPSLTVLSADLAGLRIGLAEAAARHGARVIASGTSPVLEAARTTDDDRYRDMMQRFGLVAEQQLVCGMHVHVSVASEDEGVAALDGIAAWLPLLTALSANSPFYAARDTGYASYRRMLWGQWPSAGPTAAFTDAASYHRTLAHLVTTGAARDEQMVYFDARLSPKYPTVEIRCCDVVADGVDAAVIAGLARALVDHCSARPHPGVSVQLLRAASWRAARYGMGEQLVRFGADAEPALVPAWDLLDGLLQRIGSSLDAAGDAAFVRAGLAEIRRRGTGADQQRSRFGSGGLDAVIGGLALGRSAVGS